MAALNDTVTQTSNGSAQTLAISGTAANSTAIVGNAGPFAIVQLATTTDCFWLASASGTAATTSTGEYLRAGAIITKKVNKGDIISAIQSTSSGSFYITEQV